MASNGRMILIGALRKEAIVIYFRVLSQHFPGRIRKKSGKPSVRISGLRADN
jgi:hypothetical protein